MKKQAKRRVKEAYCLKRKLVIGLLTASLIASIALSGCGNSVPAENPAETQTAAQVKESTSARPGAMWIDSGIYGTYEGRGEIRLEDDYAAAINREWAETVKINEGESNASARTEQTDTYTAAKIAVLTGEKKNDPDLTSLQNYFALLTDWNTRNKDGLEPLKPYVEDLMSISSVEEMTKYYSDPERNLYGTPMVQTSIITEPQEPFTICCVSSPRFCFRMSLRTIRKEERKLTDLRSNIRPQSTC